MSNRRSQTDDSMPSTEELSKMHVNKSIFTTFINDAIMAVKPMLARPIKSKQELTKLIIHKLDDWIYEEKYDGERLLVTCIDDKTMQKHQSRFLKPIITFQHTIKLNENYNNCIFDGELVFFDKITNKIVPICETGCRMKNLYSKYIIFDIQYCNGINVRNESLMKRKELLHSAVYQTQFVTLSKWYTIQNILNLWDHFNRVCVGGGEGLILKAKHQEYISNKRKWLKLKPLHLNELREEYDLFAHKLNNDRNGLAGILECGYYINDNFIKVCSVSSGINGYKRNKLEQLTNSDGTFKERIVVTIIADKVTRYRNLRHPIFKCIRLDLINATTNDIIDPKLLRGKTKQN